MILTILALVATLGGGAALQLSSGGIRTTSVAPGVLAACLGVLGSIVVVHRPRLRLGAVIVVNGVGFAVGTLAASALDYGSVQAIPRPAAQAAFAAVSLTRVLVAAWVLFILWFPDDRFTAAGWRRFFIGSVFLSAAFAVGAWLAGPPDRVFDFYRGTTVPAGAGGPLAGAWPPIARLSDLLLLAPLAAVGSLLQRYRRGDPVVRQQLRWLLVAVVVDVASQILGAGLLGAHGAIGALGTAIGIVTQPLPMAAATVAILRYRLWDIDLVVSRALVYGVLWACLSGLVLVPALAAGLIVGGRDALAAVGIALLVTSVFQPARRRLEQLAERLVYRHRARPYVLLTSLWETIRSASLEELGPQLAHALHADLGVRWAGVWLYSHNAEPGVLVPLGVAGADDGAPLPVSADLAGQLTGSPGLVIVSDIPAPWPADAAVVVPLVAAAELVGCLACGPRRGDALGASDFELLEMLARECALRLRNLRLESELRERLVQIEAQAHELHLSRQRLVAAEDGARRRIERNLHDGVQQQLVSLAVHLRRLAHEGSPWLADLASEAEEAVFALQELGRGIYPSVLADQGLPSALRTQAARMSIPVRIEVDPALGGQRFQRDIEAAFYYVALEALTNVQKHAPDAAAEVWLRVDEDRIILEVIDDGPGMRGHQTRGSGLQNMADRMAAIGGEVRIAEGTGGGTRVTSILPGPVGRSLQPAAADSRR